MKPRLRSDVLLLFFAERAPVRCPAPTPPAPSVLPDSEVGAAMAASSRVDVKSRDRKLGTGVGSTGGGVGVASAAAGGGGGDDDAGAEFCAEEVAWFVLSADGCSDAGDAGLEGV
jgi:hypothetical protein